MKLVLGGQIFIIFLGLTLFVPVHSALAANPSALTLLPDPLWGDGSYGITDAVGDWRPYCSPGRTNIVRWYTSDDLLRSQSAPLDCAIGMPNNASYPQGVPGAITLWNYGSNIIPRTLPHSIGNFGSDGDFYFILTSNARAYTTSTTNPAGLSVLPDSIYPDGLASPADLVQGWQPYCTPGTTNTVRWYLSTGALQSTIFNFDCAVGMPDNATYPVGIPGAISLWQFGPANVPATLPHAIGFSGGDGDFYVTVTNGNNQLTRYDWGWHTTTFVNRFDWSWHAATGYSFPVATTTPTYCTTGTDTDCNSNVLFLPGVEGSRLYAPGLIGENQIWEPNNLNSSDVSSLDMANNSSANDVYTKKAEIIDSAYKNIPGAGEHKIYSSLINAMNTLVAQNKLNAWKPIAYDWRLNYQDLINYGHETSEDKIYYRGTNAATSTPYIIQELKRLAGNSKTGKVTIIAHSNGGLVTKALTSVLGPTESARLIDKIIFVAVPQIGTPQAIGGLLHGFNQGLPAPATVFFTESDARNLAQNTPTAYNLLPSASYFQFTQNPVITFDPVTLQNWVQKYGQQITTENQLRMFMMK
jgi:hypothetical protein